MADRRSGAERTPRTNPVREFKCNDCGLPYRGKTIVRWPATPSAGRYITVCIDCLDRLINKEHAPSSIREFVSWYNAEKVDVDPAVVARRLKLRNKELEDQVRELNRLLERATR